MTLHRASAAFATALALSLSAARGSSAQLTPSEAEGVLEAHNRWRTRHQAPPLAWSRELARYAQAWAETLALSFPGILFHSEGDTGVRPQAAALGYGAWGENLHWHSPVLWSDGRREARRDLTGNEVVDAWAEEVRWYDFAAATCSPKADPGCGHFTQVVWVSTKRVGCGRAFGADSAQVWACSYDPPGNWDGEYEVNVRAPGG